jgi:ABC-2 type transport system ATP-binding protein
MDRGKLVASGEVAALIGESGSVYLEVDDVDRARAVLDALPNVRSVTPEPPGLAVVLNGSSRRADLVKALVEAQVAVETVTARRRLEDAFLGLVEAERAQA